MEYTLKLSGRTRASINLQINNITNTDTIQSMIITPNRSSFTGYHEQILDGTFATDYMSIIETRGDRPRRLRRLGDPHGSLVRPSGAQVLLLTEAAGTDRIVSGPPPARGAGFFLD